MSLVTIETADTAVQDEGGDPNSAHVETRQSKRTRSTLETVKEGEQGGDYDNTFDLLDEQSWVRSYEYLQILVTEMFIFFHNLCFLIILVTEMLDFSLYHNLSH